MRVILTAEEINKAIDRIADEIIAGREDAELAVIGVRSRGEIIAGRLAGRLTEKIGEDIEFGTLDITLYRDDLHMAPEPGCAQPEVRTTEIGFDVDDKDIILVDDVLFTGRSTRAAMDALIDLGRPRRIKLAVLVERKGREFPIQPDYTGFKADVEPGEFVEVNLVESDGKDEVIVD
jgi:pyrimidine operon attenuation protein/uracil phosphoribosyltransferase